MMPSANGYNLDPIPTATGTPTTVPDSPSNTNLQTSSSHLKCSVRGCKRNVTPDSGAKMCEVCRGKHRIYASTKRARRKLEKAAVIGMRSMSDQVESDVSVSANVLPGTNPDPVPEPQVAERISMQAAPSTILTTATWNNTAVDPQLFFVASTAPANTQSAVDFTPPRMSSYPLVPYASSTNSELAKVPTLPATASTASTVNEPQNGTLYYRFRLPAGTLTEPDRANTSTCTVGWNRTKRRTSPLPKADGQEEDESYDENENDEESQDSITLTEDTQAYDTSTATSAISPVDGSTRFCSIKGCKAVIPASYAFKMCPPCRVRYRTYGTTKRAKWKAEREAFDRELADLRYMEDERRKVAGERSLSESPEELHAWELSILDEEVSLPQEVLAMAAGTSFPVPPYDVNIPTSGETAGLKGIDPKMNVATSSVGGNGNNMSLTQNVTMIQPTNAINTPHSVPPYPHLNYPHLPPTFHLPPRMCTVSHCHKLLPGFYRYKRCEQHRLQNRYHSKLKRFREKVVKAVGPAGYEECLVVDTQSEGEDKGREGRERRKKKGRVSETEGGKEAAGEADTDAEKSPESYTPTERGEKGDEEKKLCKRSYRCTSDGCCNLLSPERRWRNCDICRVKERVARREKRVAEQAAAKEVEMLRGNVKTTGARGDVSGVGAEGQQEETRVSGSVEVDTGVNSAAKDGDTEGGQEATRDVQMDLKGNGDANGGTSKSKAEGGPEVDSNEVPGSDAASLSPGLATQTVSMPTTTAGSEPNVSPVTLSSGNKGGTYHSIFRTTGAPISTGVDKNDEANVGKAAGGSTRTTKPTILTANLTDADGLTCREYQGKTSLSTVGWPLGQNSEPSVRVFKDLLALKEKQVNTGLVGPSSYHVYQSYPTRPQNLVRELPVFVPTVPETPPFVYQPTVKKARTKASESQHAQGGQASEQEGTVPAASSDLVASGSDPKNAAVLTTTSTKRKRPSRAAPKPPQPLAQSQPPMVPYPYSNPPLPYPYSYYVPYGMPPYGMTLPHLPSSTGTPQTSSPYPPQSYYYPHQQHYGPPPPGYIYGPPGYAPAPYKQYAPQQPQPGTYVSSYGYPEYSYSPEPPKLKEYSFVDAQEKQPKRKRVDPKARSNKAAATSTSGVARAANGVTPGAPTEATPAAAGNIGIAEDDTAVSNAPVPSAVISAPESSVAHSRQCRNKVCNRMIASATAGTLCEKCRIRLKKHQVQTKQRFKLEPRKSMLGIVRGRVNDAGKDEVAVTAAVLGET